MNVAPIIAILLTVLTSVACNQHPAGESETKIVGGVPVPAGHPIAQFTAALSTLDGAGFCTATLIRPDVLVTAAHCLKAEITGRGLQVVFGPDGRRGQGFPVKRVAVHPEYNPANNMTGRPPNDIGLLFLTAPLGAPEFRPIAIENAGTPLEPYTSRLTIAGYGVTSSAGGGGGILRQVDTLVGAEDAGSREVIVDSLTLQNACYGDSGGPAILVSGNTATLVGIASYIIKNSFEQCESGMSSYTDVRRHVRWIQGELGH